MSGTVRIVIGIFLVVVLMILFPLTLDATHALQTNVNTQVEGGISTIHEEDFLDVETGPLETTAVVTLPEEYPLFGDPESENYLVYVLGITSTIKEPVPDDPIATDYDPDTYELTVDGLVPDIADGRILTVEYKYTQTWAIFMDEILWNNSLDSVLSVTSNLTEAPVAIVYIPEEDVLLGEGLTAVDDGEPRYLTIRYEVDGLSGFTGLGAVIGITPLLIWIGLLAAAIGGTILSARKQE